MATSVDPREGREPRSSTPRAQVARVVAAGALAAVLGAGPAVAWDVSTQLPLPNSAPAARKPSPWRGAGRELKVAAVTLARVYLPSASAAPSASEAPTVASPASTLAPPVPPAAVLPPPVFHRYPVPRPALAGEDVE
jgi:hypothetical protein